MYRYSNIVHRGNEDICDHIYDDFKFNKPKFGVYSLYKNIPGLQGLIIRGHRLYICNQMCSAIAYSIK